MLKVCVLMGGKSTEHEISLLTGREVVKNLPSKYHPYPVLISKEGNKWLWVKREYLLNLQESELKSLGKRIKTKSKNLRYINPMDLSGKVDVCFIALHGAFGEDGKIQGMLEMMGIPYTGSGVMTSALGIDKIIFKKILESENLHIPGYRLFRSGDSLNGLNTKFSNYPYVIKPHNQGSSVGVDMVNNKSNLKKAIRQALVYSDTVIIENYVDGMEVTCAILGNEDPIALPLIEIVPKKNNFFDYKSKYSQGGADEIVPARISNKLTLKIQKMALGVYKLLGARGFSRVDFIVSKNKTPIILEINTIPGLTSLSLFPKAAKAAGISYTNLLDKIIKYALK